MKSDSFNMISISNGFQIIFIATHFKEKIKYSDYNTVFLLARESCLFVCLFVFGHIFI